MNGVITLLAEDVNNFGDTRGGGLAGPTGLFIIIVLVVATVLLIRNMNKRIKRLPDRFPSQGAEFHAEKPGEGDGDGKAAAGDGQTTTR